MSVYFIDKAYLKVLSSMLYDSCTVQCTQHLKEANREQCFFFFGKQSQKKFKKI